MANGFNPFERQLLAATMGFGAQQPQQTQQPQQRFSAGAAGNPQQLPASIAGFNAPSFQQGNPIMEQLRMLSSVMGAGGQQQQQVFDANAADLALPGRNLLGNTQAGSPLPPPGFMESLPESRSDRGGQLADQVNALLTSQAQFRTPSPRDIQLAERDSLSAQRNLRSEQAANRPRQTVAQEFDSMFAVRDPSGRRLSGLPDQTRVRLVKENPRLNAEFFSRMIEKDRREERDITARWEARRQAATDRFNSPETQALKRRVLDRVARRRASGDLKTATPEMLRRRAQVKTRRAGELAQRRANVTARAVARRGGFSTSPAAQMQRMMQTNPELFGQLAQLAQQGQQFRDTSQFRRDELALRREQGQGTRQDAASALMAQMQQLQTEDDLKRYGLDLGDTTERLGLGLDQQTATYAAFPPTEEEMTEPGGMAKYQARIGGSIPVPPITPRPRRPRTRSNAFDLLLGGGRSNSLLEDRGRAS